MADNTRRTPSPFNVSSLAHPSSQTAHSSLSQSHSFAEDLDSLTFTNEGAELFLTGNTAPSESYNDPDSSVTGELGALDSYSYNVLQFFMSAFSSTDGIIPQIPPMYTASSKDSLVRAAVTALAMERHGLDTSNQGLLAQAQAEYGRTLLKVREALGDPVESRHDQTLATIQLLCHFEFLRSVTDNTAFTYTHGDAVPLLLKHRGAEQLNDERSLQLFLCFQSRLLLYCIDRWYSLEDLLGELSEIPEKALENPVINLMAIAREVNRMQMRINIVKQAVNRDRNSLISAVKELLRMGRDIDNDLDQWSVSLDPDWHYSVVDADEVIIEPRRYSNRIQVYPNIKIARIWNGWRTIRINLHCATDELLNWAEATLELELPQERRSTHNVVQVMVDEVCNTVHYHLGNRVSLDREPIAQFPTQYPEDLYEQQAISWGWFHLLVPLRTCAKAPALLPRQRQWIHHNLIHISRIACQRNNKPPPTNSPVLITEPLPSNAFSLPMFPFDDESGQNFASMGYEMDPFQFEDQAEASPLSMPETILPSQTADYFSRSPNPQSQPVGTPSKGVATPPAKSESQQVDLPFFNTTRPDQIKDPGVQKKIRRDVMLHHMRNQDPKQREERQRKARAGSAARAASRREQSASLSRERRGSAEEVATSSGSKARRAPSKKSSSSGKGKERTA